VERISRTLTMNKFMTPCLLWRVIFATKKG
jgi:hypothetical protein